MRLLAISVLILATSATAYAISDPELDTGAGWTPVTAGSGSVSFGSGKATLTAFLSAQAGIEQEETAFSAGQEWQLEINVTSVGNIAAGWRNASAVTTASTVYGNGVTGVRTILSDDPAYRFVFAEKTGGIGGIIDIESMRSTNVTTAPLFAGLVSASRATSTSAILTWGAASDNVTPQGEIRYRIFWSTVSGNVISEGVKATVTGTNTATITSLPAGAQVFFTVRSEDRVANRDSNTTQQSIPSNSNVRNWEKY